MKIIGLMCLLTLSACSPEVSRGSVAISSDAVISGPVVITGDNLTLWGGTVVKSGIIAIDSTTLRADVPWAAKDAAALVISQ
jgi:hypothetical protein